jgi:hypothetical protein
MKLAICGSSPPGDHPEAGFSLGPAALFFGRDVTKTYQTNGSQMPEVEEMKNMSFQATATLYSALEAVARKEFCSRSDVIRRACMADPRVQEILRQLQRAA